MSRKLDDDAGTRSQTSLRVLVLSLIGLGALLLVGVVGLRSEVGQAQSVVDDHGTYYRLKVKFTYKGELEDFDIVVGCNVHIIEYGGGTGSTYEVGLIPTVFGRRMSDGKALVVRPPSACRGETTANGQVQPDLLPLVIVYDNADTLDFGVAYLSEDAYAGPLSVLTFGGATIEAATRAEFDEFRRTQTNVVTREIFWTGAAGTDVLKRMGITPAPKPFAAVCEAYKRFRIPEELRALVRQSWPTGKRKYWVPDTFDAEDEIYRAIYRSELRSDRADDAPHNLRSFGPISEREADYGLPTRRGGGFVNLTAAAQTVRFPAAYYPAANDFRTDQWPSDQRDWPAFVTAHGTFADVDIDLDGGRTKGFAYCSALKMGLPDLALQEAIRRKGVIARVEGEDVASNRPPLSGVSEPVMLFERDEYVFMLLRVSVGSPRGDV